MIWRWHSLIFPTSTQNSLYLRARRRLKWRHFHSVTYMRQKRVVFGNTRFKRKRYFKRKHKSLWRPFYRIFKYWLEDFKVNKRTARSIQMTSRFRYSYLISTSFVLANRLPLMTDHKVPVVSGSSLNRQHYLIINKQFYINNPLYNMFFTGTIVSKGSAPALYDQGTIVNSRHSRLSYLYSDHQLIAYSSAVNKRSPDKLYASYNKLIELIVMLIMQIILNYYRIIIYLVLEILRKL